MPWLTSERGSQDSVRAPLANGRPLRLLTVPAESSHRRPHRSLANLTPAEFEAKITPAAVRASVGLTNPKLAVPT